MSAPRLVERWSERAGKVFSKVLGEELRRAREARGWSRKQFVARLPSGISERTLLAYEHGLRHLTAIRIIELCHVLEIDAPGLLARSLQRAEVHIETLPLTIDLEALPLDRSTRFRPLRQWTLNTLREHPDGIVEVTPEVVKHLALFMGYSSDQVAGHLAKFLPEDIETAAEDVG